MKVKDKNTSEQIGDKRSTVLRVINFVTHDIGFSELSISIYKNKAYKNEVWSKDGRGMKIVLDKYISIGGHDAYITHKEGWGGVDVDPAFKTVLLFVADNLFKISYFNNYEFLNTFKFVR